MAILAILLIFTAIVTLLCTYDLNKKIKKRLLDDEIFSITLINSISLIIGICVLLFPTNTPNKTYTQDEVNNHIYQKVIDTSENKILISNEDNDYKTETINGFNRIIILK